MKITFLKTGINGEGIGYEGRTPVFCDGVLPGETAEVEIIDRRKTYAKAKLLRVIWKSENRISPQCPVQKECGACALMIMKEEAQAETKKQLLEEALYKYGNVRRHFVRELRPSEKMTGYRNQCKLTVKEYEGKLVTGMYKTGTNHFVPVKNCVIHDPQLEKVRKRVLHVLNDHHLAAYDKKTKSGIRSLVMRIMDGNVQCTLIHGNDEIPSAVMEDLMKIKGMYSLYHSVNTDTKGAEFFGKKTVWLAGEKVLPLTACGISMELSPQSFFQLNRSQAEKMYETAVSKCDPCDLLVEAYCGIGAMSLMAAKKAKHVIGIESVPEAIKNAKENAVRNGISNAEFICADAADGLYRAARKGNIDILLADPPRSGMDDRMLEAIEKVMPKKIVYISCNPATLAKNLAVLKHHYHVVTVIPFDLFPNTPQIESITVLEIG